jgi:hypothetical protein
MFAFELLDERFTVTPPEGAGPLITTDPTAEAPPKTAIGEIVKLARATGFMVKTAVLGDPFSVAVIVAFVEAETVEV